MYDSVESAGTEPCASHHALANSLPEVPLP